MNHATLFNCCPNYDPPKWTDFDALEIGGCIIETDEDGDSTFTIGGIADDQAQFWTVYGHCKWGGVEALTDCPTRALVDLVADRLSELSGLPVTVR